MRLSRALGALTSARVPRPLLNAAIEAFVRAYDVDRGEVEMPVDGKVETVACCEPCK